MSERVCEPRPHEFIRSGPGISYQKKSPGNRGYAYVFTESSQVGSVLGKVPIYPCILDFVALRVVTFISKESEALTQAQIPCIYGFHSLKTGPALCLKPNLGVRTLYMNLLRGIAELGEIGKSITVSLIGPVWRRIIY